MTAAAALLIAATIWHEARGEGSEAMRLVASSIVNNATADRRATKWQTATNPKLYSCWINRRVAAPDPGKMLPADLRAWEYAVELAKLIESGVFEPAEGVRFYHDNRVNPTKFRRLFSKKLVRLSSQGKLTFYGVA